MVSYGRKIMPTVCLVNKISEEEMWLVTAVYILEAILKKTDNSNKKRAKYKPS